MKARTVAAVAISLAFFWGCYPTSRITGSWKNPTAGKTYHTVFVAALTANTVVRSTLEKEMAEALRKKNLQPAMSLDEFPPGFSNDSLARSDVMRRVKEKKSDAILTITLQKRESGSRYVGGGYAPMAQWSWYGSFWGYYNYWWPYGYSPGYYQDEEVYYLETNLYDAATEALVWSAQSKTYSYNGLTDLARAFAASVTERMVADGVLK